MKLARRIYSALLWLYPEDFRRDYAEEMTLLFDELQHNARSQGVSAYLRLWRLVLLDLVASAIHERRRNVLRVKPATVISLILCLPFLFLAITATLNYEPPFVSLLNRYMLSPDGYTPTILGRIVMLSMLLALPAAFVINLLAMFTRTSSAGPAPFRPTPVHIAAGTLILVIVLMSLSEMVRNELRPFVTPLGSASLVGQLLFFLVLLALPIAFLVNRLPRLSKPGAVGALAYQPTSINLIIGSAILLVIIMVVSAFVLEGTACSIGVPNCD